MTVRELYAFLNEKIPPFLSCEWDNDGLMCCPDPEREVRRVLVALDITAKVAQGAILGGYDVVVSHHPLVFRPLRAVNPTNPVAKKVIDLLCAGVAAMSFHTRLDAVTGGVNDALAQKLGLSDVEPFGENGEAMGRIGTLPTPMSASDFARLLKQATGTGQVLLSDAGRRVFRVALLGGSGSDGVRAAIAAGADTYVSGELGHHQLTDAPELGINLLAGGHFHTENPVCERLREWILAADPTIDVTVADSNAVQII